MLLSERSHNVFNLNEWEIYGTIYSRVLFSEIDASCRLHRSGGRRKAEDFDLFATATSFKVRYPSISENKTVRNFLIYNY